VSSSFYRVGLTNTARSYVEALSPEGVAEVEACFDTLSRQPFPGPGNKVVRLRTSPSTEAPRFYAWTDHYGILFSVEGELVHVLVVDERKTVR
jgi:hypothetical protein